MNDSDKKRTFFGWLVAILLPICLVMVGLLGFWYLKSKAIKVQRKPVEKQAVVVETLLATPGTYQSSVKALGTVAPDRQIVLKAKVSGEVVWVSPEFVQGGLIKKGQVLLKLEDSDYRVDVKKAKSMLDKAISDLEIEKGSQKIAKEELRLINQADIGEIKATDLALRKPQLIQAQASVDSARADLEKAELDLSRTTITIPFNAIILDKSVDHGALVNSQGTIATLVDTDTYRVEALVAPDKLSALKISEINGSQAVIHSQYSSYTWKGRVVRTTGSMSEDSRMAGVIILVDDPLGRNQSGQTPPLLLDDYVEVVLLGDMLENVFSVPRKIVRDGNTLWIYANGKLEIREINIAWKENGVAYIRSGLNEGDLVITSDLPAPVKGMALQLSSRKTP